jgi:signal peptide peptidase SppA
MNWNPFFKRRRQPLVAVLRLSGVIGGGRSRLNIAGMAQSIERAFKLKGVRAVALDINSPGGSPVQSALLHRRIRQLAQEKKLPVFAFTQDVAASGGYWLACAGDEIFADENSIVGSIGVISGGFGLEEFIGRYGIKRRMHTSGTSKSFLDPFLPEKQEDVERLKVLQGDIHDSFKALVRERRAGKISEDEDVLFSGEFWTGKRALGLGLIDGIGDLRSTMRERFGKKVRFRVFGAESNWLRRRLGFAEWTGMSASWSDDLLATVEARLHWQRFGL